MSGLSSEHWEEGVVQRVVKVEAVVAVHGERLAAAAGGLELKGAAKSTPME